MVMLNIFTMEGLVRIGGGLYMENKRKSMITNAL
jgi:hypothetical protein